MKHLTVTIGIATSFAGKNLLHTAQTIDLAVGNKPYQRVIYADNTPLTPELAQELKKLKFSLHWTPGPGSFFKKARKLISATTSDILILTQDDIKFDPKTVSAIVTAFQTHHDLTMVGIRVLPLPPQTLFEYSMTSMVRIIDNIARYWNAGDNYLSASGRCLAFRTSFLKKIPIPEVVNGDMYLYLANAMAGGSFIRAVQSKVFIRTPQTLADQTGPSSRYQYSKMEMELYFKTNLTPVYCIPIPIILRACITEFTQHPFSTLGYFVVFLITRLTRKPAKTVMKTVWKADASTKNIHR